MGQSPWGGVDPLLFDGRPDDCPPCFNCLLPAFQCMQYANCSEYDGRCICPPGFGGDDCSQPTCGSLADGSRRSIRPDGEKCECEEGWSGINCNVCEIDAACNRLMPEGINGTCYRGGLTVKQNFQMCAVTNRKILDQLGSKVPEVTFSCKENDRTCNFQFWVDEVESFYCGLDTCTFELDTQYDQNVTRYRCENIHCSCVPGRMLCGEEGSIDISEFLSETIRGPGSFECSGKKGGCRFSEPAMNDLIKTVFGDSSITLDCNSGECLHYTEIPGYQRPEKPSNTKLIAASVAGAIVFLILLAVLLWYLIRQSQRQAKVSGGEIRLPDDEADKLMMHHTPASLMFRNITYNVAGKTILNDVQGAVAPGQIMAIMGASGAGKTSFLDILAKKNKRGQVSGDIFVNGREVSESEFKSITGFVDQEDVLMPTLTVYETILYSALLRLPKDMSVEAKKYRVLETMNELGILGIKNSFIGTEGQRGISGGEKRRVSIACELVTSPSILFLDEPTSGLDAYNAYNVIECLSVLARDYKRTIVFTIHQPRSNIVALFDQLVLLAKGRVVYSGDASECQEYLAAIGHPCPTGYNIADYLVDLTMGTTDEAPNETSGEPSDDEPGLVRRRTSHEDLESTQEWARLSQNTSATLSRKPKSNKSVRRARPVVDEQAHLDNLVEAYAASLASDGIRDQIQEAIAESSDPQTPAPEALVQHKRQNVWGQFVILSQRMFKNLYRNPMLMMTHYAIAITLALLCGYLFFGVSNELSGFQDRLGLFFFILALFGFSTLTSLNVFASERILFVRERANGYYHPAAYFLSKVIFDVIPLRIVPPVVMALIIYPMVGLVPEVQTFFKFLLVLVLFNLTAAAICLFIGVVCKETSVANLIGSLVMLFSLLFAGLLLNSDSMPKTLSWLQKVSIFHYAYEALLVNEVRYLTLREKKFGLSIEVPGATILSTFGFDVAAFWPDTVGLVIMFVGAFMVMTYLAMHFLLVERR
ncbi:hypothetical protein SAICODRAFT_60202 [Saitoella complicata NRRL Y-17804]|uniref:uncharacterized protein n=1 Tax=Saitoella complicata (strain BCRC 22490 / CBS 7301 / JCM 7358 / NBRC 10748 / NRRL Y-17804) TaxID=698492 RepID=UPI00086765FA|nr:uncharacterized protein SAICODRAFT_60202 [Saitoella complicata NRRL Y-17804]ODQ51181.1 hypothetical protein SAICODRAFT_60202 [Saitoella complicata NRRL Y-17804]